MSYPGGITEAVLARNAHIPSDEVERDIRDTEAEIARYRALEVAEREVADNSFDLMERKMADFKAQSRPGMIAEREKFVAFLRRLLDARRAPSAAREDRDG